MTFTMNSEQMRKKIEELKKTLLKKEQKLHKYERLSVARQHVKKRIKEQAQLDQQLHFDGSLTTRDSSRTKVTFERQLSDEEFLELSQRHVNHVNQREVKDTSTGTPERVAKTFLETSPPGTKSRYDDKHRRPTSKSSEQTNKNLQNNTVDRSGDEARDADVKYDQNTKSRQSKEHSPTSVGLTCVQNDKGMPGKSVWKGEKKIDSVICDTTYVVDCCLQSINPTFPNEIESQLPDDEQNNAFIAGPPLDAPSQDPSDNIPCLPTSCINVASRLTVNPELSGNDSKIANSPTSYESNCYRATGERSTGKTTPCTPGRSVARGSDAAMMDFSFLEEEGDMYSQIKGRHKQRRQQRALSLDSQAFLHDTAERNNRGSLNIFSYEGHSSKPKGRKVTHQKQIASTYSLTEKQDRSSGTQSDHLFSNSETEEILTTLSTQNSDSKIVRRSRATKQIRAKRRSTQAMESPSRLFPAPPRSRKITHFDLPKTDFDKLMKQKVAAEIKRSSNSYPVSNTRDSRRDKCSIDMVRDRSTKTGSYSEPIGNRQSPCQSHVASTPLSTNFKFDAAPVQAKCSKSQSNTASPAMLIDSLSETYGDSLASEDDSMLFSKQDQVIRYNSSIRLMSEEPLISLCCMSYSVDRTRRDFLVGCTALRVMVWVAKGSGWRQAREWNLDQLQAECVVAAVMPGHVRRVAVVSTAQGVTQLALGGLDPGDHDVRSVWKTKHLTTHTTKHLSHCLNIAGVVIGSVTKTNVTQLYKIPLEESDALERTIGNIQASVKLADVQDNLHSLANIEGIPEGLFGAGETRGYIWNSSSGCLLTEIDIGLEISGCLSVVSEEGMLFMHMAVEDRQWPGCLVVVNPITGKSCVIHGWEIPSDWYNVRLLGMCCAGEMVCARTDDGRCVVWSGYSGQLVAYSGHGEHTRCQLLNASHHKLVVHTHNALHVYDLK